MGIYELLILNEALRPLILNRAPASTIAQKAIEFGMRTLRIDGWNKVRDGADHDRRGAARHADRGTPRLAGRGYQGGSVGEEVKTEQKRSGVLE